jgi:hypothetical protein
MELSGQLHAPPALLPGERAPGIVFEAGLAPDPVCGIVRNLAPAGNLTLVVEPEARRYSNWYKDVHNKTTFQKARLVLLLRSMITLFHT